VLAGRAEAIVEWSPGPGQLAQVKGAGVTDEELSTVAQGLLPPPRLDATPLPAGFQEVIRRDGASLPPATPRGYEVGTTPQRGPARNPGVPVPSVRILAVWGEALPAGETALVRDRPAIVTTGGTEVTVAWLERADLRVSVTGTDLGLDDVRRIAAGLREQSVDEILARPSGARVIVARGELGGIAYELRARGGSPGACLELARGSLAITCASGMTATVADLRISIGMGVAFGPVSAEAASVRLELAGDTSVETEALGAPAGLGAAFYVVALAPDFGRVVAVVALGPDGHVLRRTPVG
jgi:hypothetical protein